MTYGDLLPSLIANQLAVVIPGRVLQPLFPKWYNPSTTCAYHGGAPGHSVEQCLALKSKVQGLIEARWLTFQEDGPNIKRNPLANHGGGAVNYIEVSRSHVPKLLKDVTTSRRFIYKALQKAGVIPHGRHKEDSCLMHLGVLHDMETCSAVRDLLGGKKEVKVGTSMTAPIREELVALLRDYQDVFAWSYQDMPGLNSNIVQHRLPLNPECSPVKEEVKKQFDIGFLAISRYLEWVTNIVPVPKKDGKV